jgi:hypothetical protein
VGELFVFVLKKKKIRVSDVSAWSRSFQRSQSKEKFWEIPSVRLENLTQGHRKAKEIPGVSFKRGAEETSDYKLDEAMAWQKRLVPKSQNNSNFKDLFEIRIFSLRR